MVEIASTQKRHFAVNENMRWDPAMRAGRHLIADGWIGDPMLATVEVNYWEDWSVWPWLKETPRLTILFDAIHPIYSLRMIFGEPTAVFAAISRAGQAERGETCAAQR